MGAARFTALVILAVSVPAFGVDWNARLAADYLDGRQKAWFAWKTAQAAGGPCFSCHTGATYLLARPALRRVLGEPKATEWETGLRNALRARSAVRDPSAISAHFTKEPVATQALGVEAVFSALFLTRDSFASQDAQAALDRLWALQIRQGEERGKWRWFTLDLDPYETPASAFYGASIAALAIGTTPASYRDRADVKKGCAALFEYLDRVRESQPLHNRLMLLWASARLPDVLPIAARVGLIAEIFGTQQPDGGWTMASLGAWKERGRAPETGSNAYATGLVVAVLQAGGTSLRDERLTRGLEWLASHQDKAGGFWTADSMNKTYPAGSMEENFMRDAATAFAALALAEASERVDTGRLTAIKER